MPKFRCWDNPKPVGRHWAFGWLTGIDRDLICIFPNIQTRVMEHWTLSPVSSNRFLSLLAFIAKRFLFLIDHNLRGGWIKMLHNGTCSKGFHNWRACPHPKHLYGGLPSNIHCRYLLVCAYKAVYYTYLYAHVLPLCIRTFRQTLPMLVQQRYQGIQTFHTSYNGRDNDYSTV